MTTNHIDQLTGWWETAEKGAAEKGDTLIWRKSGPSYEMFTADEFDDSLGVHVRILARAPKPKPAWHDAVAVLAECVHDAPDQGRGVFINDRKGGWVDETGGAFPATDLTDVTPLIEAKVTDEMVKRARAASMKWEFGGISENATHAILTAALGLDPA